MKKESKIKIFLGRIVRVREWMDWVRVRAGGKYIEGAAKDLFVLKHRKMTETFKEAQQRMNLSDEDLAVRSRALFIWSVLTLILAFGLFCYGFYHFIYGSFPAGVLLMALTGLSLGLSFRYSFWYFQIKTRKLGCSYQDWFQYTFKGKKL